MDYMIEVAKIVGQRRNRIKTTLCRRIGVLYAVCLLALSSAPMRGQTALPPCSSCAIWNAPQAPFRIYGNTYYVGPHGLSSILITSDHGHVLIDGALPESAPLIAANIRALGFRLEDVKLILNSHVHSDHAGGIAELQRLSGARVAASPWSAAVLKSGGVAKDDPQYGEIRPIAPVSHVEIIHDGQQLKVGNTVLTAHFTPGHTPGGTSWTWTSCEAARCENMVYEDSLSPVSADGFKFTKRSSNRGVEDFEKSFTFLESTPCDILITPHPEVSDLWERLDKRNAGATPNPMIGALQCKELAQGSRDQLNKRLASEAGK